MPLEIIGDNTCMTSIKPTSKVVRCRGTVDKYWLEIQFVDENNLPVVGLNVRPEYLPLASDEDVAMWKTRGYTYNPTPPPPPPAGVTDSQGMVRFDELYPVELAIKVDGQQLADEMEQRTLGLSRNPNSQPVSNNPFKPESRNPAWRTDVQISAEQQGHIHHYVTIGELCDRMPEIPGWMEKVPPGFHFPHCNMLKGTKVINREFNRRHVIEVCPFRAWLLALHDTKDYSMANGYNLGVLADMAYAKKGREVIKQFFLEKCLDLSTTPKYDEFPSFPYALVVDVPFSQRYTVAEYLDSALVEEEGNNETSFFDSTQLFYVESAEQVVVSWRGTQEVPDWLTDGSYSPQPCPPELAKAGLIHGGFLDAYNLAKERFEREFKDIKNSQDKGKKLFICGHSLGGGAGTDLCRRNEKV